MKIVLLSLQLIEIISFIGQQVCDNSPITQTYEECNLFAYFVTCCERAESVVMWSLFSLFFFEREGKRETFLV